MFTIFELGLLAQLVIFGGLALSIFALETRHSVWPFIIIALALFLLSFFFGIPVSNLWANPGTLIVQAIAYLIVGLLWSFYRWSLFLKKYYKSHKPSEPCDPGNFKGDIAAWIFYWPLSLFWWIAHDPLTAIGRWLVELNNKIYVQISNRMYRNIRGNVQSDRERGL